MSKYDAAMQKQSQANRLWKLSAMGFTFASMIIAGGLLGFGLSWVLDQPENKRVFIVLGTVVGIIIGMADFIRAARRAIREIDR